MSEGAPSAPSSPGPSSSQHADQGQEKEGRGRGKGGKGKDSDKEVVALQVNYKDFAFCSSTTFQRTWREPKSSFFLSKLENWKDTMCVFWKKLNLIWNSSALSTFSSKNTKRWNNRFTSILFIFTKHKCWLLDKNTVKWNCLFLNLPSILVRRDGGIFVRALDEERKDRAIVFKCMYCGGGFYF